MCTYLKYEQSKEIKLVFFPVERENGILDMWLLSSVGLEWIVVQGANKHGKLVPDP